MWQPGRRAQRAALTVVGMLGLSMASAAGRAGKNLSAGDSHGLQMGGCFHGLSCVESREQGLGGEVGLVTL